MAFFKYSKTEMDYLSAKDKRIAALIAKHGKLKRKTNPDLFHSLISSIVAQQISNKASITVSQRLNNLVGVVSPETINLQSHSAIQQCGMTGKKATYIKNAAEAILSGKIKLDEFQSYDDNAIIAQLKSLPGIGVWTAEMLLLHSLQRPNIFSFDDLIIRRNLSKLHNRSIVNKAAFDRYRKRYSPYCSVAMIYLWQMES